MMQFLGLGVIFAVVLGGVYTLAGLENDSVGTCIESPASVSNLTEIIGSGTQYLTLPGLIPEPATLHITYTGSGSVSINSCTYPVSSIITVPRQCLSNPLTVSYSGVSVTNTTIDYTSLESCSLSTADSNAVRNQAGITYSLFNVIQGVLFFCLAFSIMWILIRLLQNL